MLRCKNELMGWKEFFASVIGSLAWPTIVLLLVIIILGNFRRQIRTLISRVKSIQGGGVEATFGEDLEAVRDTTDALIADAKASDYTEAEQLGTDPLATIIRSWLSLEATIDALYRAAIDISEQKRVSARTQLSKLLERELIPSAVFHTVLRLQHLRNTVVHGEHLPTAPEAESYADSVSDMADYLVLINHEYLKDWPLLGAEESSGKFPDS